MQFNTKNLIDAQNVMERISSIVPIGLLLLALLSFIAIGIFSVDYYEELFKIRFGRTAFAIAILIAVIQELVRFFLLVASIRDFSKGEKFSGWLGLLGSLGLVVHDILLANKVAKMWSNLDAHPYSDIFLFLIFIGFLLEIRLILTMRNNKKEEKKPVGDFSFNGATSTPNGIGRSIGEANGLS